VQAVDNPPNPWHHQHVHYFEDMPGGVPRARLALYPEKSRSILSRNDSPDLGFRWSLNPYRGCVHGCAYCYARQGHERLDWGAGSDFERKIVVKHDAAKLLRATFDRSSWKGELIAFSGMTDCYQAIEANYGLTRACLEVCRDYRNPVAIITKSPLIERDIDLLVELHSISRARIMISIPVWKAEHARAVEPWVPSPQRRMKTIGRLAMAGLDVGVMVAPMIPGLGDEDMPTILAAAAKAGASCAGTMHLRLPGPVAEVFVQRVRKVLPLRAEKILAKIRRARGGKLNDPRFGERMRGDGAHAEATRLLFASTCARLGLASTREQEGLDDDVSTFQRPAKAPVGANDSQMTLF
jgi:DNA repair photolyase